MYYINPEDISIANVCYTQMLISVSIITYETLASCSEFLKNSMFFHSGCFIFIMWLRLLYIIRYFSIPEEASDKYYKTIFYLRILMIENLFILSVFTLMLLLVVFLIVIQCCAALCPNTLGIHSFLIDVTSALNGGASSATIQFVAKNMPRTKYNPDKHTEERECVICMEEFVKDMDIIELPCHNRHYFHVDCIMDWMLKGRRVSCPICRKDMAEELAELRNQKRTQSQIQNISIPS